TDRSVGFPIAAAAGENHQRLILPELVLGGELRILLRILETILELVSAHFRVLVEQAVERLERGVSGLNEADRVYLFLEPLEGGHRLRRERMDFLRGEIPAL